jgi:hypothetical protein
MQSGFFVAEKEKTHGEMGFWEIILNVSVIGCALAIPPLTFAVGATSIALPLSTHICLLKIVSVLLQDSEIPWIFPVGLPQCSTGKLQDPAQSENFFAGSTTPVEKLRSDCSGKSSYWPSVENPRISSCVFELRIGVPQLSGYLIHCNLPKIQSHLSVVLWI